MGVLAARPAAPGPGLAAQAMAGKPCPECGQAAVIHKDGCDFCTSCGYVGQCG
jgi:ribonucleoside-diphosphate reductase alpha chain